MSQEGIDGGCKEEREIDVEENVVNKIYHDRVDRLASSGIKISRNDFMRILVLI